jgi:predicted amidohydrolase
MIPMTIATAQSPISGNVRENGRRIRDLMQSARERNARLVHFPEGALSGYAKSEVSDWRAFDWPAIRNELESIARTAGELDIWVVVGCAHHLSHGNRPHNSLYIISDKGVLAGRYDKRLCSHNEISNWYSPGFEPLVFSVDGFTFGCALCIEVVFPEIFLEYERAGVDCVLFSAYSSDPIYATMLQGHAAINNLWISLATPAQCSLELASGLIGPDGAFSARCEANGRPGVSLGQLDRSRYDIPLTKARPWRAKARAGRIYSDRRVVDRRSSDKLTF